MIRAAAIAAFLALSAAVGPALQPHHYSRACIEEVGDAGYETHPDGGADLMPHRQTALEPDPPTTADWMSAISDVAIAVFTLATFVMELVFGLRK